jgi:membrane fusion protein, multidrug efflux system
MASALDLVRPKTIDSALFANRGKTMKTTLAALVVILMAWLRPGPLVGAEIDNVLLTLIDHVELPAKESGAISELSVREGDLVEKGRGLGSVEDEQARMNLAKAQQEYEIAAAKADNDVQLRFARKAHEVARAEHRRALESSQKFSRGISETEMDQLRLAMEKAELEIEQADHDQAIARLTAKQKQTELDLARHAVERRQIRAPFDGMIVQRKKQRGEWVDVGETVLRMVRLDRLRVEAFLPAREAPPDLAGRRVSLSVDLPGSPKTEFTGTIVFVSPEINAVNGQVRVWAEVENTGLRLRPGQPATMTILAKQ